MAKRPMEKMLSSKQHDCSLRVVRGVAPRGNFIVLPHGTDANQF